jgi:hypothetical protein
MNAMMFLEMTLFCALGFGAGWLAFRKDERAWRRRAMALLGSLCALLLYGALAFRHFYG